MDKESADKKLTAEDVASMDIDQLIPLTQEEIAAKKPATIPAITFSDISTNILYIIRGVELNQPRLLQRAIRQNVSIRKYVQRSLFIQLVQKYVSADFVTFHNFMSFADKLPDVEVTMIEDKTSLESKAAKETKEVDKPSSAAADVETETMDIDESAKAAVPITVPVHSILPEVEIYIFTLLLTTLLRYDLNELATAAGSVLIQRIHSFNRRSLDLFSSKAYFYYSLSFERVGRLADIRATLLGLYRTSCVRRDEMGQAVLLNLLLRNYLHYNLFEQARTLSLRASFPENASNNQFCRYLFYMGRIMAVQLEYSEAYQRLLMAARKAPPGTALGFTRMVNKLIVIVQLLMGEIPERRVFNQPELRVALKPYLALTQAVRTGDLIQFNSTMQEFGEEFKADETFTLVQRLGHNVLKTGLRKISLSYSRVSLADIAEKLHLESAAAAEYICAKAIRDGVIEAKIDHENGWLASHEVLDLYSTEEPQRAFHKRITFCLDVHNEAVKSMRYPPEDTYNKNKPGAGKDLDLDKTIEELLRDLEDDFDE